MKRAGKLEKVSAAEGEIRQMLAGNSAFQFWLFQQKWKDIAGSVLAAESRIGRREGTTLYIHVTNSVWMQELMMHKRELLQRVQADPYGRQIQDLRFMIAPPQSVDTGLSSVDRLRAEMAAEKGPAPLPLTGQEEEWIHRWTEKNVQKDALRPVMAKLMEKALSHRKAELAAGFHPCRICGELCEAGSAVCRRCAVKEERAVRHRLVLLLESQPALLYEDARKYVPCRYSQFSSARDTLIHKYKENYANGWGKEEEIRKLLALLTHRPFEDITKEEAGRILSALPKKKKFRK